MNLLWLRAALGGGVRIALRHLALIFLASLAALAIVSGYSLATLSSSASLEEEESLLRTPILAAFDSSTPREELRSIIDKHKLLAEPVEIEMSLWTEEGFDVLKLTPDPRAGQTRQQICGELAELSGTLYVDCSTELVEHEIHALRRAAAALKAIGYVAALLGAALLIALLELVFKDEEILGILDLVGASRAQRWILVLPSAMAVAVLSAVAWSVLAGRISEVAGSLLPLSGTTSSEGALSQAPGDLSLGFLMILAASLFASLFVRSRRRLPLFALAFLLVCPPAYADVVEFLEGQLQAVEMQLSEFDQDLMVFEASLGNQRDLLAQLTQESEEIQREIEVNSMKLKLAGALAGATPRELEPESARLAWFALQAEKAALEREIERLEAERSRVEQKAVETEQLVLQPIKIEQAMRGQLSELERQRRALEAALAEVALEPSKAWKPRELGVTFDGSKGLLPWPVDGEIARGFNPDTSPPHLGIEIAANPCEEVESVFWGRVRFAGVLDANQTVIIEHESGYYTIYSGMEELYVETGEEIPPRSKIGRLRCDRPQLTFELHRGESALNPLEWLLIRFALRP